jgi:hypothetical protein
MRPDRAERANGAALEYFFWPNAVIGAPGVDLESRYSTHGQGRGGSQDHQAARPGRHQGGRALTAEGNGTMRFLGYTMGDDSAPQPPPSPELMAEMGKLVEEATKAGVLLATGGLAPTAEATKVVRADGKFTVIDGPFTEAKELIGGWALMEVRDKEEAIEWTKRFLSIAGDGESTIRQVYGP